MLEIVFHFCAWRIVYICTDLEISRALHLPASAGDNQYLHKIEDHCDGFDWDYTENRSDAWVDMAAVESF